MIQTGEAINAAYGALRPGNWLEYHRGMLSIDRETQASPKAVGDAAYLLAVKGALLVQQRHGYLDYSYLIGKPG